MENGAQCVMMSGVLWMLESPAGSWAFFLMVRLSFNCFLGYSQYSEPSL